MRVISQLVVLLAASSAVLAAPAETQIKPYRDLIDKYCVSCHNNRAKTAGLTLEGADLASPHSHAQTWEKVIVKLDGDAMPPPGLPRPAEADRQRFISWLETSIDAAASRRP